MRNIKKLNKLNIVYIIFFWNVLFINIIFLTSLKANSFKITNLEISEPFELNFNKDRVIDKGFKEAFIELISMTTTTEDKKKIQSTPLSTIKGLVDSFTMSNERFINNEYFVNFDVNFNKKNTLNFFEKKNIFPSIPEKKKLLIIPVIVDLEIDKIFLFTNNIFYKNWNKINKSYFLINYFLPSEDLEDVNLLLQNSKSIEEYNFKKMIQKYDVKDFIITIIYKDENELKILSKIKLKETYRIDNKKFQNIDLNKKEDFDKVLDELKNTYENYWKNINQINTSIKLPLTISLSSKENIKIKILENNLKEMDLVSNFEISKFNNERIYYKITYNGPPNKFLSDMFEKGIKIDTQNQLWEVE